MARLPDENDLSRLPLRAIVAFAARCARRVLPVYQASGLSDKDLTKKVEKAISVSESFASGVEVRYEALGAGDYAAYADSAVDSARAAANAANAAARAAANAAARADVAARIAAAAAAAAAADAAYAAYAADAYAAARADFDKLLDLNLGGSGELGSPVDPSEQGPLGLLWKDGPPWTAPLESPKTRPQSQRSSGRLVLEAEVNKFADTEEVAAALANLCCALNAYHIAAGGNGLAIDDWQILVPEHSPVGVR